MTSVCSIKLFDVIIEVSNKVTSNMHCSRKYNYYWMGIFDATLVIKDAIHLRVQASSPFQGYGEKLRARGTQKETRELRAL